MRGNLAAIRSAVGPGVRVVPVVKADAYGHGLVPVALALATGGADGLAVATFDEAVLLRREGVASPILVLQPTPVALVMQAADERIALTLGEESHVRAVVAAISSRPAGAPALAVELEVETGLGRGGVAAEDVARIVDLVRATPGLELVGTWSHLQAPEKPDQARDQVERFEAATAGDHALGARHLSATGSLLAGTAPPYDAVRPGLAVYGLVPDELLDRSGGIGLAGTLRPAMALRARPIRVATLPAGWGVSYGPTWRARRPSRIATLPVGYGDGWPRSLSNRAAAIVRGIRVPLVGNVAMDAVMADVTDIPGEPVTRDDTFTLLGSDGPESISAHELARSRTTNAWEVVTSMSGRLTRVYYLAAVPVGLRTLTSLALTGSRDTWPGSSSGTGTSATWRSTRS